MSSPFASGPTAADRIAADPFWSVVRRRHPDVDIVLLPPENPPETSLGSADAADAGTAPDAERDDVVAVQDAEASRLWQACTGRDDAEAATSRWTGGRVPGASRFETTWRQDGVDAVEALTVVQRAARVLEDEGWHVLAPVDGLPRVLAGRGVGPARVELQLVHSPGDGRLVQRLRSADVRLSGGSAGDDTGSEGQR